MQFFSLLALAPLAALVAAMPQALPRQAHQRANITHGHLPPRKGHAHGLEARQTAEDSYDYAGFGGVDWINGYHNDYAISGQIIVPSLKWRSDGPATQLISIWVGIGSTNCDSNDDLAQTGIVGQVYSDGSQSWYAFYEWADAYAETIIQNFPVNVGDTISMQIVLDSSTSATANLDNKSTGQTYSDTFSGPYDCASDSFWLVEDVCYTNNIANCALAEFPDFYITDALVIADDEYINAAAGSEWTMSRNGQDYVHVGDRTSNIIYGYVGPN